MVPLLLKPDGTTHGGWCKTWPFSLCAWVGVSWLWPSLPSRRPSPILQVVHVSGGSAGRTQRVGASVPLHTVHGQPVTLHLLVPTTLRNGHENPWPRYSQVLSSHLPGPDLPRRSGAKIPQLQPGSPLPALCLSSAATVVRSH